MYLLWDFHRQSISGTPVREKSKSSVPSKATLMRTFRPFRGFKKEEPISPLELRTELLNYGTSTPASNFDPWMDIPNASDLSPGTVTFFPAEAVIRSLSITTSELLVTTSLLLLHIHKKFAVSLGATTERPWLVEGTIICFAFGMLRPPRRPFLVSE